MPQKVLYFTGILLAPEMGLGVVLDALRKKVGGINAVSESFPFDCTDYYATEMGEPLTRYFVSFEDKAPAHELSFFKAKTNELEQTLFSKNGKRQVNLDPGYIDAVKVVLASTKYGGHKIALGPNCYADMVMDYYKGRFRTFDWSFPDFKSGRYDDYFKSLRNILLKASC